MNSRKIFVLILTFGIVNSIFGQTKPYKQIETALSNSDIEVLVSLAPEPEFGTLQFSTPNNPEIGVSKNELSELLTKHFDSIGEFEYSQLFANNNGHLLFVVGKLTGDEFTQYAMIGLAKFGENYRYVSFSFLDQLPPNMKQLDK